MRAAERQAGAGWGAPVVIGAPDEPGLLGSEIWSPATQQVTLDARDDATVVWNSEKTGRAQYALRFGVNAGWQAARPLASESLPELAVDASGIVTAVWTGGSTAAGPVVVATRVPAVRSDAPGSTVLARRPSASSIRAAIWSMTVAASVTASSAPCSPHPAM